MARSVTSSDVNTRRGGASAGDNVRRSTSMHRGDVLEEQIKPPQAVMQPAAPTRVPRLVRHRAGRGIQTQREPGALATNALGVEYHIAGVFLQRLQDQRAELARRRPFLVLVEPDAVVGHDDRHPATFLLADQPQLATGPAD